MRYVGNVNNYRIGAVFLLLLVLGVIVYGSSAGIRGTDQYQYVEDTRTLSKSLDPVTNLLFPAKLLREGESPQPAFFHHHGPPLHIASWMAQSVDSYTAWIVMNVVSHAVTGLCIFLILLRLSTGKIAFWSWAFYLVSPIAIWQTMNALQEQLFAALVSVSLCCFVFREKPFALVLGMVALLVGILSHPIFMLPFILFCIFVAFESMHGRCLWRVLLSVAMLVAGLGVKMFLVDKWFPSSFQPNLAAIISSAIPGESNMLWHYALEQRAISIELIVQKIVAAVNRHFFKLIETPFYIFTNLGLIALAYLTIRHWKSCWKIIIPCALYLGLYAAMISLQQNQPRYQQIVASSTFVLIGLAFFHARIFQVRTWILVLSLSLILCLDIVLAKRVNTEAKNNEAKLALLESQLLSADIPLDARLLSINLSPHSPLAITVKPRIVLSVKTSMMNTQNIVKAINYFEPTHAIVKGEIDMQLFGLQSETLLEINKSYFGKVTLLSLGE